MGPMAPKGPVGAKPEAGRRPAVAGADGWRAAGIRPAGGGGRTARERRSAGGPANFKCKRNGVCFWFWVPFESF